MPSLTHATGSGKHRVFAEDIAFRILLALALALGGAVLSTRSAEAQPLYSCSGSCHAANYWLNPVNGASVSIMIRNVICGSCDGFVSNVLWYTGNYGDSACPIAGTSDHYCWIETGYSTWGNPNHHVAPSCTGGVANCFYWADNRPNGGYHEHAVANITQYDIPGAFSISRTSVNATNWDVVVFGSHYQSTSNHFGYSGKASIQIGQELAGTSGASSPRVDFTNNAWLGTTSSSWQYQHADGTTPPPDKPPYGNWETPPHSSSTGGDFCAARLSVC